MKDTKFYTCKICGNTATLIKSGGKPLSCCGQTMSELEANTTDASKEKHVPIIQIEDQKIIVTVGSEPHPMLPEHYIEWIAVEVEDKMEIVYLKPEMEPKTEFTLYIQKEKVPFTGENDDIIPNCETRNCNFMLQGNSNKVIAYAFCNIHGLWKAEAEL